MTTSTTDTTDTRITALRDHLLSRAEAGMRTVNAALLTEAQQAEVKATKAAELERVRPDRSRKKEAEHIQAAINRAEHLIKEAEDTRTALEPVVAAQANAAAALHGVLD